jgi:hypothetical protein
MRTRVVNARRERSGYREKPTAEMTRRSGSTTLLAGIETFPFVSRIAPGGSFVTAGVGADATVDDPVALAALTTNSTVDPASADVSTYVWADAPEIVPQRFPELSQRYQLKLYEIVCVLLQLPIEPVTVLPTFVLGAFTVGFDVFAGADGAGRTADETLDPIDADPALFFAVTIARSR